MKTTLRLQTFATGLLLSLVFLTVASTAHAQNFTVLHSLTGSEGSSPSACLISGDTLFGTAIGGGSSGNGTIFSVNTDGTLFTTAYSFTSGSDGANPHGLILSGNTLYGAASQGGTSGNGTVFKVNIDGTGFTVLHHFTANSVFPFTNSDGKTPSGLVLSGDTLYGTASRGGSSDFGTVFAVNTDGTGFTALHHFTHGSDGANPQGLILSDNTLYGTTPAGGTSSQGTVFKVQTDGTGYTTLYRFTGGAAGYTPYGKPVLSGDTLYGTTFQGGSSGDGTVFSVDTSGAGFTTLHSFTRSSDGSQPYAGLLLSGNTLYGTAAEGGSSGRGTVFALDADGTGFTVLHNLNGGSDGSYPYAGLISSANALYGTTTQGGSGTGGTVFSFSVPGNGLPCPNPTVVEFSAGTVDDDFAGPEPASPSAGLLLRLGAAGAASFKGFDNCATQTFFAHTFTDLPSCITGATLHIRLRACGSTLDGNDTFGLGFTDHDGQLAQPSWGRYLGNINVSGGNGLFNTPWGSGPWGSLAHEIVLDLSELQNADGVSTTDLIPGLNAQGFLDLTMQDDSAIDFAVLTVTSCCCEAGPNLVENGSFEITNPVMPPNSFNNSLHPLTGVPGWTTTPGNYLEIWGNTMEGIPASDGVNQLEINAQSDDQTVSQVITNLRTDCETTFSFDYTGRFGEVGGTPNNDFIVTLSGGHTLSIPLNPAAYAVGGWTKFSVTFVPTSPVTIEFRGQPHFSDGTIFTQGGAHIDNVSLTQCCEPCGCAVAPSFTVERVDDCTVELIGMADTTTCTEIIDWIWDFGDDTAPVSGQNVTHTYASSGVYKVCLTVIGTDGVQQCEGRYCETVAVDCPPCVCAVRPSFTFERVDDCTVRLIGTAKTTTCTEITDWIWDFGDDTAPVSGQNVTHTYASSGVYKVCLTVIGTDGVQQCEGRYCETVAVDCPPCVCAVRPSFTFERVDDCTVRLIGTAKTTTCTEITDWIWNFGDGTTLVSGPNVTHTYASSGVYEVCLTVIGTDGQQQCEGRYCEWVPVDCPPCVCAVRPSFTFERVDACTVRLIGTAPATTCTEITDWIWNFGDGTTLVSGPKVTHTYASSGVYEVCLTVIGTDGEQQCEGRYCETVAVDCPPCRCAVAPSFTFERVDDCTVRLIGTAKTTTCTEITDWIWNFGDGTTLVSGPNVTHTYASSGVYEVCLTVIGTNGEQQCEGRYCETVAVDCPPCRCAVAPSFTFERVDDCTVRLIGTAKTTTCTEITDWIWDFGDGTTLVSGPNVTHTYASSGVYEVCLTVIGTNGEQQCEGRYCETVAVDCPPCVCAVRPSFTFERVDDCTVRLIGTAKTTTCTEITDWIWDFGDGTTLVSGPNVTHTYASSGVYEVCLTVIGTNGEQQCEGRYCETVAVDCPPCVCAVRPSFTFERVDDCTVRLIGTAKTTTCTEITDWIWDFGDGTTLVSGPNVTHTYASSGVYEVCLTVIGTNGEQQCEGRYCETVAVDCPPCVCAVRPSFTFERVDDCTVRLIGTAPATTCTEITDWIWDFGDGTTLVSGPNVTHTYASSGVYEVCLTVIGTNGEQQCEGRYCETVAVDCPPCVCAVRPSFTFERVDDCTVRLIGTAPATTCTEITDWIWDFGDGTTLVSGPNVTHTYASSGIYNVCLTVIGTNGEQQCEGRYCETVAVDCPPCVCAVRPSFTVERVDDCTVRLIGTAPATTCTEITDWIWDFGDGTTLVSGPNVTHTYASSGIYNVCLTVIGTNGEQQCEGRYCETVAVDCPPCVCAVRPSFTVERVDDCTVRLIGTAPATTCTEITDWIWDFGDGTTLVSGPNVTHTYTSSGIYEVCLRVIGTDGVHRCEETYCEKVRVDCELPNGCALILDECIVSNANGGWTYEFDFVNHSGLPVQYIYLVPDPFVVAVTPINLGTPLPNGATTHVTVDIPPFTSPDSSGSLCFIVSVHTPGFEVCCAIRHCVDLPGCCTPRTYTLDADFDEGFSVNLNHTEVHDQLQVNALTSPFPYVWIAASGRGTIVKIDSATGTVLGEYLSAPDGRGRNPSRTTVDKYGNCWVGNRAEDNLLTPGLGDKGSVTRYAIIIGGTRGDRIPDSSPTGFGLDPNPAGQYLEGPFIYNSGAWDRDGDGLIKTSRGSGDILPWSNNNNLADNDGGVSTADDEAIITYIRTTPRGVRTMAVDANNDLWVGGYSPDDRPTYPLSDNHSHEKYSGITGATYTGDPGLNPMAIAGTLFNLGLGGYGAVIDGNNVLWSAGGWSAGGIQTGLLRYDATAFSGSNQGSTAGNYGLSIDACSGFVWHTTLGGWTGGSAVYVRNSAGSVVGGPYSYGNSTSQGVCVDQSGNVFVAHSIIAPATTVGHLRTDGTYVGNVPLVLGPIIGRGPTGVAVDDAGKIWVSCQNSHNVMRIDPNLGPPMLNNVPNSLGPPSAQSIWRWTSTPSPTPRRPRKTSAPRPTTTAIRLVITCSESPLPADGGRLCATAA